jgi:hypothetical protein
MNDTMPTPRTDSALVATFNHGLGKQRTWYVNAEFARQLEKELTVAMGALSSITDLAVDVEDFSEPKVRLAENALIELHELRCKWEENK